MWYAADYATNKILAYVPVLKTWKTQRHCIQTAKGIA